MRLPRRCAPRNDNGAERLSQPCLVHPAGELFTTNGDKPGPPSPFAAKLRPPRRLQPAAKPRQSRKVQMLDGARIAAEAYWKYVAAETRSDNNADEPLSAAALR